MEDTKKNASEELAQIITALYTPAASLAEAEEVRQPVEMVRSLETEMGLSLTTLEVNNAMVAAGFIRQAIHGRTYWLVNFA
jgi:hypothetical protein